MIITVFFVIIANTGHYPFQNFLLSWSAKNIAFT